MRMSADEILPAIRAHLSKINCDLIAKKLLASNVEVQTDHKQINISMQQIIASQ